MDLSSRSLTLPNPVPHQCRTACCPTKTYAPRSSYGFLVGHAVALTVVVRVMQPSGHVDEQPSTYSTVLGSVQPQGSDTVSR